MIRAVAVLIWLVPAVQAAAGPKVNETVRHYTVFGNSFSELRQDMARRGKNGFWGYTEWWVNWSARCEVELEVTVHLPRLGAGSSLSASDKRIWVAMVNALKRHENLHVEHGRQAAKEIHRTACDNPRAIVRKWADRDVVLDRATRHGVTQGVWLPD